MSAANDPAGALELLRQSIDELTRKIRDIDPNDPTRGEYENELYALRAFNVALQPEHNKLFDYEWSASPAKWRTWNPAIRDAGKL